MARGYEVVAFSLTDAGTLQWGVGQGLPCIVELE